MIDTQHTCSWPVTAIHLGGRKPESLAPEQAGLPDYHKVCANCGLRELCIHHNLSGEDLERLDVLVPRRRKVRRGQPAFHNGAAFQSLYAVRVGSFKSVVIHDDGRDQITGFQMPGDLLGLDGMADDRHTVDAVALQDSELCVIPRTEFDRVAQHFLSFQHQLQRAMSREIVREQGVMLLLGSLRADERVASLLINLSVRQERLGLSASELALSMTRAEIGSYLGLKLETVSRCFSRFQAQGLISVQGRQISLLDLPRLRKAMGQGTASI